MTVPPYGPCMDPMVLGARNVRSPFHLLVAVFIQGQCGSRNQGGQRSLWWPFGETRERLEGQPTSQANTFTKPRNVESQVFNASCCHPSFCSHRSLKTGIGHILSSNPLRPRNPRNEPHVDRRPWSSIAQRQQLQAQRHKKTPLSKLLAQTCLGDMNICYE